MSFLQECNDFFLRSHTPDEIYQYIYDDSVNKNYNNHIVSDKMVNIKGKNSVINNSIIYLLNNHVDVIQKLIISGVEYTELMQFKLKHLYYNSLNALQDGIMRYNENVHLLRDICSINCIDNGIYECIFNKNILLVASPRSILSIIIEDFIGKVNGAENGGENERINEGVNGGINITMYGYILSERISYYLKNYNRIHLLSYWPEFYINEFT